MESPEPWVGTEAVAEHLGQSVRWVRQMAPAMPHVKVNRQYRFRLSEVDAWVLQWRGGDIG